MATETRLYRRAGRENGKEEDTAEVITVSILLFSDSNIEYR